jgi:6-phosphogluconolactonase
MALVAEERTVQKTKPELIVYPDKDALNVAAAEFCAGVAREAIAARGRCMISLSGGSTPKSLYALLAKPHWIEQFDWKSIHLFWGDERCVPIDHPDSNYGMVERELLSKAPIPKENVHRYKTELGDPEIVAADYEMTIRNVFGVYAPEIPRFDLILLGLGENGHTASLFPHCPALHETKRLVLSDYVEEVKACRLTVTAPLINAAHQITFLISGASKAQVVKEVLEGPRRPEDLPAQLISPAFPDGKITWLMDKAAAALVE